MAEPLLWTDKTNRPRASADATKLLPATTLLPPPTPRLLRSFLAVTSTATEGGGLSPQAEAIFKVAISYLSDVSRLSIRYLKDTAALPSG